MDQPTVDGFNTFFVARTARRSGLTVALSGIGADELFGGYATFRDVPRIVRWHAALRPFRWAAPLAGCLTGQFTGRGAAKVLQALRRRGEAADMYLLRRELFLPKDRRGLFTIPSGSDSCTGIPRSVLAELRESARGLDPLNQISCFESSTYLQHMLLRDADIFSMVHGLEVRVPFLDHQLVELVAALPGTYKKPTPNPKALLVEAVGPRFPRFLLNQPKRGFTFPWNDWLRGPLRNRTTQVMTDRDRWTSLGLNAEAPLGVWSRFQSGDRRVGGLQILALSVLADYAERHKLRVPR
jgi:asparagine synthase (glutamine-hydrolysing)